MAFGGMPITDQACCGFDPRGRSRPLSSLRSLLEGVLIAPGPQDLGQQHLTTRSLPMLGSKQLSLHGESLPDPRLGLCVASPFSIDPGEVGRYEGYVSMLLAEDLSQ